MSCTVAIITAGGCGSRTHQNIPKQFILVNGKPILIYTLEAFQNHPDIDAICVPVLKGWDQVLWSYAKQYHITKLKYVVNGGATGQESIFNGLKTIRADYKDNDVIVVHDGDRPLVSGDIISDNLAIQKEHGSAVAYIPCTEVVFMSEDGKESDQMIPREKIIRTQTPHSYYLKDLWDAHLEAQKRGITDTIASCSLMNEIGKKSFFSKGSEKNFKITTMDDIDMFQAILSVREHESTQLQ